MITIPRESNELLPLPVEVNGVQVATGVQYQITAQSARPVGLWLVAEQRDGVACARVDGLTSGTYRMWCLANRGDEGAVLDMGLFGIG